MREPESSMIQAALLEKSYGENRLTSIFASALQAHSGLALALLSEEEVGLLAGEATAAVKFDIAIHRELGPDTSRTTDIEILASDGSGRLLARLWCENKYGEWREEPGQLDDQYRYLKKTGPPNAWRLLAICPNPDDRDKLLKKTDRPPGFDFGFLTWEDVANLVDRVGGEERGDDWCTRALDQDSPSKRRVLAELLTYMERSVLYGSVLTGPEERFDSVQLGNIIENACGQIADLRPEGPPQQERHGVALYLGSQMRAWIDSHAGTYWVGLYNGVDGIELDVGVEFRVEESELSRLLGSPGWRDAVSAYNYRTEEKGPDGYPLLWRPDSFPEAIDPKSAVAAVVAGVADALERIRALGDAEK
jgi:hypothetical protein